MTALRRFDRWCQRHPLLSWAFVIALAGDLAFVAAFLGGCTAQTPHERAVAACQAQDAGNPVSVAECLDARR